MAGSSEESIEPVDALRRIAFLLERSRAGTYRVQAFRNAVDTVIATPARNWTDEPTPAHCNNCPASARQPKRC